VSKNLKEYESLLADQSFMRVHNSFLINLREVKKYVKSEGGYILMKNGAQISISQKKREEFVERMTSIH
jgi:two-component system LytT family response regulator